MTDTALFILLQLDEQESVDAAWLDERLKAKGWLALCSLVQAGYVRTIDDSMAFVTPEGEAYARAMRHASSRRTGEMADPGIEPGGAGL